MRTFQVFLATDEDWCTIYTAGDLPDFCAIQGAYPLVTIYDVSPIHNADERTTR